MISKCIRRILLFHFTCTCILMILCLIIVITDYTTMTYTGQFKLLPILNVSQFKVNGTLDDQFRIVELANAYIHHLNVMGYGIDDPLWCFININTIFALGNVPIYYIVHSIKVQFPRYISIIVWIANIIALALIVIIKCYVDNCYGSIEVEFRFPVAYTQWPRICILTSILIATIYLRRLCKRK